MLVGLCELFIYLPDCNSLKNKRSIIKNFKALMKKKYNISIAEIGSKDSWKRSTIGVGCIGDNCQLIDRIIDKIVKDTDHHPKIQLVNFQITIS